jgi:hypothetical protein
MWQQLRETKTALRILAHPVHGGEDGTKTLDIRDPIQSSQVSKSQHQIISIGASVTPGDTPNE